MCFHSINAAVARPLTGSFGSFSLKIALSKGVKIGFNSSTLITLLSILFGIFSYFILCKNITEQKTILRSTIFRIKKND